MSISASLPPNFNYAKALGFASTPAAIVFAIFFTPLFIFYLRKSFKHPSYIHIILSVFCAVRLVAFIIRAVLAGNDSAGHSLSLLIADEVLFAIGFTGLLYSVYGLIQDRDLLASNQTQTSSSIFSRLLHTRTIFRLPLVAAVSLGVSASVRIGNDPGGADSTTKTLHDASIALFLILTLFLVLQAARLLLIEMQNPTYSPHHEYPTTAAYNPSAYPPTSLSESESGKAVPSFGQSHGAYILCVVGLILLVRELFLTITTHNTKRQNEEQLWYPLVALPELLVVVLFGAPGLVPRKADLPK